MLPTDFPPPEHDFHQTHVAQPLKQLQSDHLVDVYSLLPELHLAINAVFDRHVLPDEILFWTGCFYILSNSIRTLEILSDIIFFFLKSVESLDAIISNIVPIL